MSNPLESWTEEQRSAFLYRACAEAEAGTPRADLFTRLAGEAEAQAAIWRAQLTASGKPSPKPFVPELRTRLVARLVGWLGPRPLRAILAAMKVRGMVLYTARVPGGHVHAAVGSIERRHRGLSGGGNLSAAVFGINDGLVSNASLIFGVAGASSGASVVLLTGIAGLTAGALGNLQDTQIALLASTQVGALTATNFSALDATAIGALTPTQLKGVTTTQIGGLTATALSNLSSTQIGQLATPQLAALNTTNLGRLATTQVSGLNSTQIASLSQTNLGALNATSFGSLNATQIGRASCRERV